MANMATDLLTGEDAMQAAVLLVAFSAGPTDALRAVDLGERATQADGTWTPLMGQNYQALRAAIREHGERTQGHWTRDTRCRDHSPHTPHGSCDGSPTTGP